MKTKRNAVGWFRLALSLALSAHGQSVNVLGTFDYNNGSTPAASLISSGGVLFGTASDGGSEGYGTVFAIATNGGTLSNLYSFLGAPEDGSSPEGSLAISGNMLYGTTPDGGSNYEGTIFAINTSGGDYSVLYNFSGGPAAAEPEAGLLLYNGELYGTASAGGLYGNGAVFKISTGGGGYSAFHSFLGGNSGEDPEAPVIAAGNTLYGTTYSGGSSGNGIIFRVNTDGTGFANLHSLNGGSDGANPQAGLLLAGGFLYGTTTTGGDYYGTVFEISTNGTLFQAFPFNYSVGANPQANLILIGSSLLGTSPNGGGPGWGTLFQLTTCGQNFVSFYDFTDEADGASPEGGLLLLGNTLYGTTSGENGYGYGTVFSMPVPPIPVPLYAEYRRGTVTVTWTNPVNGSFVLQGATNVTGPFTNISGASSPYTTSSAGKPKYFRLLNN